MALIILLFSCAVILLSPVAALAGALRIGSISVDAAAEMKKFLPLGNYLAEHLQPEGIEQGTVVVARSVSEMAGLLKEGKVDIYIDSPFPALAVSRLSESKLLLRRWKKGVGEYRSVLFARADGRIHRVEDLKGGTVAFEEPFSTTGYFLPKMGLVQRGFQLIPKTDPAEPVGADETGYVFANDDENIAVWVLRGKVAAGAMDDQSFPRKMGAQLRSVKILETSPPVPRQIVSIRADLSPQLVSKIRDILLGMDRSDEGKKALQRFERTTKFDELPPSSKALFSQWTRWVERELGLR